MGKLNKVYKTKKIIIFLLIFSFILTPFTFSDVNTSLKAEAAASTVDGLKKQINDQNVKIKSNATKRKDLEAEIAKAEKDKQNAYYLKSTYDNLLTTIQEGISETEKFLELNDELIAEKEKQMEEKQAEYDKSYETFLQMLKFSYEDGNIDYIGMILKSENFSDFLSKMDSVAAMVEYNKKTLENLQADKKNMEEIKAALEESKQSNEDYRNELNEKKASLNTLSNKVNASIQSLDATIEEKKKIQEQINSENTSIQNDIARLSKQLQDAQASQKTYVGGTLRWPVELKFNVVSSPFGNRTSPITGRSEFHTGIDIPATYGTNVYAANDGIVLKVVKVTGVSSYGKYIVVDHGGGLTTLYAHNSEILKNEGDKVYKGDVIARIGSTGASTGPHCHFEVAVNGVRQNPLNGKYLVKP